MNIGEMVDALFDQVKSPTELSQQLVFAIQQGEDTESFRKYFPNLDEMLELLKPVKEFEFKMFEYVKIKVGDFVKYGTVADYMLSTFGLFYLIKLEESGAHSPIPEMFLHNTKEDQ